MEKFGCKADSCSFENKEQGNDFMNVFYCNQFVQNETLLTKFNKTLETSHYFEHGPLVEGTVVGTIRADGSAIQTFVADHDGYMSLTEISGSTSRVVSGHVNYGQGILYLCWNKVPESLIVNACYEYIFNGSDWNPVKRETNFVKPTFKKFFDVFELADIAKRAHTISVWDFNSALGDTIREKYESLYVKVVEMNNVLISKGAMGYFWIVSSPEITSIFETVTVGFFPISENEFAANRKDEVHCGVRPQGLPEVTFQGTFNNRWRLYACNDMPKNMILMGCNDVREDNSHYGRLMIANFIN